MDKYGVLKKYFGYSEFRDGQESIIDSILSGNDVMGIMPTGGGKSICYQVPALMFEGITLVISPLISLMKDQISALKQNAISCATINSHSAIHEMSKTYEDCLSGKIKILYVSPERLENPKFVEFSKNADISFVAIDESHCVSQWGQDFRSSYLKISDFIINLKSRPVVSAFTATATQIVREDIVNLLRLNNPKIYITGFDRKNLFFEVKSPKDKYKELIKILNTHIDKSTIIYCSTRKETDLVCQKLNDEGYKATVYHAGLSNDIRKQNQDLFVYDKVKIMVATNAFGMGIDKSDVSLVVHYNMPGDIESYYQEAGRAGRDSEEADCILLFSPKDIVLQKYFINNPTENNEISPKQAEELKKLRLKKLYRMIDYCESSVCLRRKILSYFGEKPKLRCDNCSKCIGRKDTTDITVSSQKIICGVIRTKNTLIKDRLIMFMKGNKDYFENYPNYMNIQTFGVLSNMSVQQIEKIIDYLIELEYLEKSLTGELIYSKKCNEVLFSNKKVHIPIERLEEESYVIINNTQKETETEKSSYDVELFNLLRKLRKKLADAQGVPAFVIFTDGVLKDICRNKPKTFADLRLIKGMSDNKITKYGLVFIKAVCMYEEENSKKE